MTSVELTGSLKCAPARCALSRDTLNDMTALPRISIDDAATVELIHLPFPLEKVIEGTPTVGIVVLGRFNDNDYGVWELTPGTVRDNEENEVAIILSGRATLEANGEKPRELVPGTVLRLEAGAETIWTVTETLRKVWFTNG